MKKCSVCNNRTDYIYYNETTLYEYCANCAISNSIQTKKTFTCISGYANCKKCLIILTINGSNLYFTECSC